MEKEVQELKEVFKMNSDYVLIELITENNEYIPGISRLNKGCENYVLIQSVGEGTKQDFMKPGDYALTRPEMNFKAFSFKGKDLSIIYKHDITAVIPEEVLPELQSDKQKNSPISNGISGDNLVN